MQVPPQPSEAPQALPLQVGVQQLQEAPLPRQSWPAAQPLQTPPQPSDMPQPLPLQLAWQTHLPDWQSSFA